MGEEETLFTGQYKVSWAHVSTQLFDTSLFKKMNPTLAKDHIKLWFLGDSAFHKRPSTYHSAWSGAHRRKPKPRESTGAGTFYHMFLLLNKKGGRRMDIYPSYTNGTMTVTGLARICGLSRPTVYKYIKMMA